MGLRTATTRWARDSARARSWREARYRFFAEVCRLEPDEVILDVGAGSGLALARFNSSNPIVAVDLVPPHDTDLISARPNTRFEIADATDLPFSDREFPVVFSNSVIEHVPAALQQRFADEVRRVGERYFVQTPNRFFPIEPHYQMPFVQFLPERALRWLNRNVSLGWRTKGKWEPVRLLSASELQSLFPDARIYREKLFGLTKSLMAVRQGTE